jgi:hypothetical protein
MDNQQVQKLATIATRFNSLNVAAKNADNSLKELRFNMLDNILNEEELNQLNKAMEIINKVYDNTHVRDAVNIFNKTN